MRCVQRRVLRWYDRNNVSSNFWNLTNDAPLDSFNQRARDSSSLERTKRTTNRRNERFVVLFVLYRLLGLVPMIFSKILEVRGTKMKKIHEELWAERRRELPPRQERSPRRHGAGPLQDEPAAGARVKTSVERRRPTAFRDGGLTVFLFKTGKYWNGKGRNIPYKWRFKSKEREILHKYKNNPH